MNRDLSLPDINLASKGATLTRNQSLVKVRASENLTLKSALKSINGMEESPNWNKSVH